MQVLRYPFDRTVLGRNAYANLYQFQAQLQYLKKLQLVSSYNCFAPTTACALSVATVLVSCMARQISRMSRHNFLLVQSGCWF